MTTQSEQINELSVALIAAQQAIQPAKKDSVNPHFKSAYASLQSVWDAARPVLAPNGLAISQGFTAGDGSAVTITTTLIHKSGQWIRSALTMTPQRADPQGIGSAITYGRRYGLSAMLGIVADEDDDGNAASHAPQKTSHAPAPQIAEPVEQPHPQPAGDASGWRSVIVPPFIKKHAGKRLCDVPPEDVAWWAENYEPRPYKGEIQQKDIDLKAALVAANKELNGEPF